jgi:hypothetical protein
MRIQELHGSALPCETSSQDQLKWKKKDTGSSEQKLSPTAKLVPRKCSVDPIDCACHQGATQNEVTIFASQTR